MRTLTIRMPDEKHARLRQLAESQQVSMNKLIEELATAALVEFDAETRFRARAALGSPVFARAVRAALRGPAGQEASIVTIWIVLNRERDPRFVTAYPET